MQAYGSMGLAFRIRRAQMFRKLNLNILPTAQDLIHHALNLTGFLSSPGVKGQINRRSHFLKWNFRRLH